MCKCAVIAEIRIFIKGHERVPWPSRSLLFFFPLFRRMKERKINSKFWSQELQQHRFLFPGCVTQEGLCIGRRRSLLAHWVRQVECFLWDAWLSKWAQFYNVVCMIIFISSEREHVSHGTAEGAFLKNHLNIKTTDFEGVKTRWPWKPDMFTSVAFLWDVLFL